MVILHEVEFNKRLDNGLVDYALNGSSGIGTMTPEELFRISNRYDKRLRCIPTRIPTEDNGIYTGKIFMKDFANKAESKINYHGFEDIGRAKNSLMDDDEGYTIITDKNGNDREYKIKLSDKKRRKAEAIVKMYGKKGFDSNSKDDSGKTAADRRKEFFSADNVQVKNKGKVATNIKKDGLIIKNSAYKNSGYPDNPKYENDDGVIINPDTFGKTIVKGHKSTPKEEIKPPVSDNKSNININTTKNNQSHKTSNSSIKSNTKDNPGILHRGLKLAKDNKKVSIPMAIAGGAALGYGAKKLYDNYRKKKEEEQRKLEEERRNRNSVKGRLKNIINRRFRNDNII